MERNVRDESRREVIINHDGALSVNEMTLGGILRIADALEIISGQDDLKAELERYKNWYEEARKKVIDVQKTNNELRKHIKRLTPSTK